ncbi:MAG: hypothetical protein ACE5I7_18975 [Candidatus Binatia bacterium]
MSDLADHLERLGNPLPTELRDPRIQELDANRHRQAEEIRRLADVFTRPQGIIEDGVYRLYHQSIKVATVYATAFDALDLFARLCPVRCRINPWFLGIAEDAKRAWTDVPDLRALNADWTKHARPVIELAFHCEYFLKQFVRYETEDFVSLTALPSGVAAILYLYGLR